MLLEGVDKNWILDFATNTKQVVSNSFDVQLSNNGRRGRMTHDADSICGSSSANSK